MRLICRCSAIMLSIFLIFLVPFSVFAHPGKTDGNGGHYDRDTGEYHYHHGYPAHDHYDMDGDRIVDCPYNFDDQTGINSGGTTDTKSYSYSRTSGNNNSFVKTKTVTETVIEEVPYIPTWVYWAIGILVVLYLFKVVQLRWRNDEIDQLQTQYRNAEDAHKKALSDLKSNYDAKLEQAKSSFDKTNKERNAELSHYIDSLNQLREEHQSISNKYQLLLDAVHKNIDDSQTAQAIDKIKIPKEIYFINGNVPVKGKISERKPFGDYTVYVSQHGKCFHLDSYCGSGFYQAKHLFDVIGKKTPCQKCAYSCPLDIPEWYKTLQEYRK